MFIKTDENSLEPFNNLQLVSSGSCSSPFVVKSPSYRIDFNDELQIKCDKPKDEDYLAQKSEFDLLDAGAIRSPIAPSPSCRIKIYKEEDNNIEIKRTLLSKLKEIRIESILSSCYTQKVIPENIHLLQLLSPDQLEIRKKLENIDSLSMNLIGSIKRFENSVQGFILCSLFLVDLIGRSTIEGKLLQTYFSTNQKIHYKSNYLKYFLITSLVILYIVVIYLILSVAISNKNPNSAAVFFSALFYFLVIELSVDIILKFFFNFYIPNLIYELIAGLKIKVEKILQKISYSTDILNIDIFSASHFFFLSQRAVKILNPSPEKFFICSYSNTDPENMIEPKMNKNYNFLEYTMLRFGSISRPIVDILFSLILYLSLIHISEPTRPY